MLEEFREYLALKGKSKNTINSYYLHIKGYYKWFWESFGRECSVLYRENILDYISYLRNIKKDNGRTINCKISALIKYNEFLVANGIQQDQVVSKNDNIKIQQKYANPSDLTKQEVDAFRQQQDSLFYSAIALDCKKLMLLDSNYYKMDIEIFIAWRHC
ncbi:phage integrase N-terminal SAM-like domain-containing protein [Xylanivirga thermophila]|uniref:phage integrase N-terminal SAM-like domain-containing protein n=1 Tax=Xylanivirga thermophila TaxID=2496273 RepID=UPI001FB34828|nr:phage integrase N-terminal SAM-like domain-containing protein [Xylanivirga thermophila]